MRPPAMEPLDEMQKLVTPSDDERPDGIYAETLIDYGGRCEVIKAQTVGLQDFIRGVE